MRFLFSIKTNENEMKKMYLQICQYIVNIYYIIIDTKKKPWKNLLYLCTRVQVHQSKKLRVRLHGYFKETLGNLRTPCANDNVYISHNYELLILI